MRSGVLAIDTETMGLRSQDRLCVVQLSWGDGVSYLVQIEPNYTCKPKILTQVLTDARVEKLFHFARFDIGVLLRHFNILCRPVFCTKIASRLCRTYTNRHGLKTLCHELLNVSLCKENQSSDWGAEILTDAQKKYAANDVLYLHALRKKLEAMLRRESRFALAQACFEFLPQRVMLDYHGFCDDLFSYD